jgi:lantibiotic modifying enzyme
MSDLCISAARREAQLRPRPVLASEQADRGRRAACLEVALGLGRQLVREALWDGERCNWIGWSMEARPEGWRAVERSFGPELYAGTSGIALFLTRLVDSSGERDLLPTAQGALRQAWSRSAALGPGARQGLYTGLPGLWLASHELARLSGDEGVSAQLREVLEQAAAADLDGVGHDVIGGSAGVIGLLLRLADELDSPPALELARRHGERLLASGRPTERGLLFVDPARPHGPPLCGFGHGAAGIGWALLELGAATGDGRYRAAAREVHRYERTCFDAGQGNWPDLREVGSPAAGGRAPSFGVAWCHGAVGIGLARLRAARLDPDDPQLLRERDCAARTAAQHLHRVLDAGGADVSPCHGLGAAAEFLGELAPEQRAALDRHDRPEGVDALSRFVQRGVEHGARGTPWPCGVLGGGEAPGLMLGLAGIGHTFLRLAVPEQVDSVLCLGPRERRGPVTGD